MQFRKLLLRNIKKEKNLFLRFTLCFIIASAALTINPFFTSRIIGCFDNPEKTLILNNIIFWLVIFAIFKLLQAINQYFTRITMTAFETTLNINIVAELFANVHKHNLRYFDDEMTGRISTAITKSAGIIQKLLVGILFSLCRPLINFLFAFTIIAYTSPQLALILALICIPFFFILRYMEKRVISLWRTRGTAEREYTSFIVDSITNYKAVRHSGSFFSEQRSAFKILKNYLRITYNCETERAFFTTALHTMESCFTLSCYFSILYLALSENISLANVFFAFSAVNMLNMNLSQLKRFCQDYAQDYGELTSNIELIYKPIEIKDKTDAYPLKIKKASISFQHVDFAYNQEKQVFSDLNLSIPAGQKVGLVGLSGAGKSTLINLLMRSYLPQSGTITINKHNINDVTELSLHQNISYVPQDVTLFNRSLYENLKIGNPKADKKQIIIAAKSAYIHDTIKKLDKGYDSIVGERGILLSGGERQRIAIARAVLQNAPILILDEATSALDSVAEIMIQNALSNLMQNKTVIAIAHRLSTLRSMDRIIVLDNGKIIEDDTPQNLLNCPNSLFKHLYELQTNGYLQPQNKEE